MKWFVFVLLSGRVFDLMCALEELGSERIEQWVARYFLRQDAADGYIRISQNGIASELGTAREVVFRALRSLVERRLVRTGRMRVQILDRARLAAVAGAPSA